MKKARSVLSFFLVFALLLSCSVPAYAEDGNSVSSSQEESIVAIEDDSSLPSSSSSEGTADVSSVPEADSLPAEEEADSSVPAESVSSPATEEGEEEEEDTSSSEPEADTSGTEESTEPPVLFEDASEDADRIEPAEGAPRAVVGASELEERGLITERVTTFEALKQAIANVSVSTIIVTKDIEITATLTPYSQGKKTIRGDVPSRTLMRAAGFQNFFFGANNSHIILENITLDGGYTQRPARLAKQALMYVGSAGAAIYIRDNVTLQNNCNTSVFPAPPLLYNHVSVGGAINNRGGGSHDPSKLVIEGNNIRIQGNSAYYGGAIATATSSAYSNRAAQTIINGGIITGNTARYGGALYGGAPLAGQAASITVGGNAQIYGNAANPTAGTSANPHGGYGGGVYLNSIAGSSASLALNSASAALYSNTAAVSGGGVYSYALGGACGVYFSAGALGATPAGAAAPNTAPGAGQGIIGVSRGGGSSAVYLSGQPVFGGGNGVYIDNNAAGATLANSLYLNGPLAAPGGIALEGTAPAGMVAVGAPAAQKIAGGELTIAEAQQFRASNGALIGAAGTGAQAGYVVWSQYVLLGSVSLSTNTLALQAGGSRTLTHALSPANASIQSVSWASSKPSVASVDAAGSVTAYRAGTAVVTVSVVPAGGGAPKTASCTVKVTASADGKNPNGQGSDASSVTSIRMPQKNLYLIKGKKVTLRPAVSTTGGGKADLTWRSSNKRVRVNSKGTITARNTGTAIVTVKAANGKKATIRVHVVPSYKAVKVTKAQFSGLPKNKTIAVGEKITLKPKLTPYKSTNAVITWRSSRPSVLSVDASGRITAKRKGSATITMRAGGKKVSARIRVK